MNILLVSEGVHEFGDSLDNPELCGALEAIVRQLTHEELTITPRLSRDERIRAHLRKGKGDGYFKLLIACMRYAEKEKFDAVIVVIDEDGEHDRVKQVDAAQDDDTVPIRRAVGISIRTFDAWMLADNLALSAAFNCQIDKVGSPESLKDGKAAFRGIRDGLGSSDRLRDLYARIGERARIEELEAACPKGFAPFADRVRKLLASLP